MAAFSCLALFCHAQTISTRDIFGHQQSAKAGHALRVAGGGHHTVLLNADGTVECWGDNSHGQCSVPKGLRGVVQVTAGEYDTVALKSNGTVVCWGDNSAHQCAVPENLKGATQVAAGSKHTIALTSDGTVVCWGENSDTQCTVPAGLTGVTQVAAGAYHSVALKADGTVVCWGNNTDQQCDVPTDLKSVAQVAAGRDHTIALKLDGTVVCWGNNDIGQCTVPPDSKGIFQVAAGGRHALALRYDGLVVCWGDNTAGECLAPYDLHDFIEIAAGSRHSIALNHKGGVVCWGDNFEGQCAVPLAHDGQDHTYYPAVATINPDVVGMRSIENVFGRAGIKFSFDDHGMGIVIYTDFGDVDRARTLMRQRITSLFTVTCIGPSFQWSRFDVMRFQSKEITLGARGESFPPGFDEADVRAVLTHVHVSRERHAILRWRFRPYYTDQGLVDLATEFSVRFLDNLATAIDPNYFRGVLFHHQGKPPTFETVDSFYEPRLYR